MPVVFGLTTGEFVIAGILPDVAADLAVSIPAADLLVTAYALGMIVGGPVVTVLTARVARKPLIVGLVAVSVIGNLGSVLAPTHALVLASRFVAGLVVATFFAVAIGVAVEIAHADRRASAIAQVTLGLGLGIVLGTPIGTAIGQQLGWRATFLAVALFGVLALAAVVRFVPARAAVTTGSIASEQAAPTLAIAVNASGIQVAAAFAGLLGGWVIDSRWGLPAIYPVAAVLTLAGAAVAGYARRWDAVGRT